MRFIKYTFIFLLAATTITYTSYKLSSNDSVNISANADYDKLLQEFNNSYLAEIESTGNIVEHNLVAAPTEINFLGDVNTKVWAYNNQVPGSTFRLKLGDTLRVNFTNNLPQDTTIHWHGVRVPNAMDGVPGVTQDPIPAGGSFIYEFTPKDAGTFWFHPHQRSSEQIERGLYGVLIVEDPAEPKYSQDLVWVLDDWRLDNTGQIYNQFNTMHDLMHDGRWGNVLTVNGNVQPSFSVASGERIRIRMINASNGRVYRPKFSDLNAQVIAVDGMMVKENFSLGDLDLSPGNRIDVDVVIPRDKEKIELIDYFTRDTYKLASLDIRNEIIDTPQFDFPQNSNIPDWGDAINLVPNLVLTLDAERRGMKIVWTINGRAYPNVEKITLKANEFNKILLNNKSSRLHPMHLHGQFFKVLSRNGVPVEENYWRDTVLLKSKESVEIGLVPLDKGLWVNHCHILEHAEAGMMTIVEVI